MGDKRKAARIVRVHRFRCGAGAGILTDVRILGVVMLPIENEGDLSDESRALGRDHDALNFDFARYGVAIAVIGFVLPLWADGDRFALWERRRPARNSRACAAARPS